MSRVAVIDYGMGNLHSVAKALEHVGGDAQVVVTSDPQTILRADRVVFPGVGAIRDCMGELKRLELDQVVREAAQKKPLLAVCVGMQALMSHSAENGGVDCLDIIPGQVEGFPVDPQDPQVKTRLKVPHMGWNQVRATRPHPLWENIARDTRFYFVHSFYTVPTDTAHIAATTEYGFGFASALARDNIFAVQFHPEKSAAAGLNLYANFLQWDGQS